MPACRFASLAHVIVLQAVKIDPYLNVDAGTLGPLEYVAEPNLRVERRLTDQGMESASFSQMAVNLTWILATTSGTLPCVFASRRAVLIIPSRYLDITLTRDNNITTGKIYQSVIVRVTVPPIRHVC